MTLRGSRFGFLLIVVLLGACQFSRPSPPAPSASTSEQPGSVTQLESCYDGDTCRFVGFTESVRLARIDTPERDGACRPAAQRARRALVNRLHQANTLRVVPQKTGYYGRIIGEVYADYTNISDWMLQEGYAVPYGEETCRASSADSAVME